MTEIADWTSGASARNWQTPPHHKWAFWNLDLILPSRDIAATPGAQPLVTAHPPIDVLGVDVVDVDGVTRRVIDVLGATATDAYVVVHKGRVVAEGYQNPGGPTQRHTLMSITKSIVGCVAGILVHRGVLDPQRPVTDYVPALAASGYAGARVRDVLDMRTGVVFREDYLDPTSQIAGMADWLGWQSIPDLAHAGGLYGFLQSVRGAHSHGGAFTYRSADSDVLGWVCERATGQPIDVLIGDLLWRPMGASRDALMLCDGLGVGIHDGGLATTARDLARFGMLIANAGMQTDAVTGETTHVIPPEWLRQTWTVDADARAAFSQTTNERVMPGAWYRNQFWLRPDARGADIVLGLGIFGQMLFVDRSTSTVAVKFSSWDLPQHTRHMESAFRAFDAISAALGAVTSQRRAASLRVGSPRLL